MSAEGPRLNGPIEWGGVPIDTSETPHVVSELVATKPELWERLLKGPMPSIAIVSTPEVGEHIILGDG